jgi:hypothetical protein
MANHIQLFDVHTWLTLGGEATFALRAPLDVIAQLFYLAPEALRRCECEKGAGDACELYSNGKTRGAWGSMRLHALPLHITVRKTEHVLR